MYDKHDFSVAQHHWAIYNNMARQCGRVMCRPKQSWDMADVSVIANASFMLQELQIIRTLQPICTRSGLPNLFATQIAVKVGSSIRSPGTRMLTRI